MSQFNCEDFIKELLLETVDEAGYAGQGHTSGAESFHGSYFGFGGTQQLAGKRLNPATQKIEDMKQAELKQNLEDQQKINRGYPAPQSVTGFAGGDGAGGPNSGARFPSTVPPQAKSVEELEADEEKFDEEGLEEQSSAAASGTGRSGASDGSYRNLPGFPRMNSIEKQHNFVPRDEKDVDGDGEEDIYLDNDEYVGDVLRLNGLDLKPGSLKRLFGTDDLTESQNIKLDERTLYHGTSNEHLDSIKKIGLSGELGDFVKDSYGINIDEDDWEEHLENVTFAADKAGIAGAVGAMRYHVGKKLGKWLGDVDETDLRQHGMLVIIKDVEEPEPIEYPEDVEDEVWYNRPEDDDASENYPMSVEPGDWFVKGSSGIDDVLTGQKMIQFLRRMGGLQDMEKDKRRELIKLAVAHHGADKRDAVIKIVKALPEHDLWKQLETYRKLASDIIAQQKADRFGGKDQKHRGDQLAFDFGESVTSLKKVFFETGNYNSPGSFPEPDRGTERYKQGDWNEVPQGDDHLINPVHRADGHTKLKPADKSPGAQAYGQVGWPKGFVPDDWEQRHPKTKVDDDDKTMLESQIKNLIKQIVAEELKPFRSKKAQYTGVNDDIGHGDAKGGSGAFNTSRKKVFDHDEENRPEGPEEK